MARRATTNNAPGASNPVQEFDQAAIDAALAGAVTDSHGSHPMATRATSEDCCKNDTRGAAPEAPAPVDPELEAFGKACFNLDLDAKRCFEQTSKHEDDSIKQYLRSINQKIYNEVRKGGYSIDVVFRVAPQDWVNVHHIMDWYEARGFQILNYETTSEPYGKNVGTVCYNFRVSWASTARA